MVVAVASPSSAPPAAGRPHPTYKEMVVQALTELRKPGGSSRRAIAMYIADHFSGLPAHHDALLSVHLRRLRSQGILLVSGYSYLLSTASPRQRRGRPPKTASNAAPPLGQKRGPGRPRKNADLASSPPVPVFHGPKRRPGRSRTNAVPVASSAPLPGVKRGPGRPPKNAIPVAPPPPSGVKRGPGRPRRNAGPTSVTPTVMPGGKRRPGRPPKNAPMLAAAPSVTGRQAVAAEPVEKGRPGRPRKLAVAVATLSGKRRPGRPPKSAVSNSVAGARWGRGRPHKMVMPAHSSNTAPAMPLPIAGTRKRGRPPKEKIPPGNHVMDKPMQPGFAQSADTALTRRGPGRPRKEKTLGAGNLKAGGVVAAQMTEAGVKAQPAQAAEQAEAVQNRSGARHLPLSATPLTEKRGHGRPRKRPLETETTETGVAALVAKRGPGRPRKANPSAARSEETGDVASIGNKRGRGRPKKNPLAGRSAETENDASIGNKGGRGGARKDRPFETEPAVEVSRDLGKGRSGKDEDLVSGKKSETKVVFPGEGMGARSADTGGVLMSGEKAAIGPVEGGGAMSGIDAIGSNLGTTSL
uniref:H15 domain-containing protein n=1 Tax=Arundo donax TaxID=35708 RepID=A0A0A9FN16_ARUDO